MPVRLPAPPVVAACLLAGCAAPETSKGLLDTDGDGLAETVTVLNGSEDRQTILLHLQKIEASRRIQELAARSHDNVRELYDASRVGAAELLASESRVARAEVAVIDAVLALARTGLLSASESTVLDTDGDGLPDLVHLPVRVDQLLDQKIALCLKILDQCRLGYAQAEANHKAGRASAEEMSAAALHMYEAELSWLDAQLEQDSSPHDPDAR